MATTPARASSRRGAPASSNSSSRRKAIPERWLFADPVALETAEALRKALGLSLPFSKLLVRRGLHTADAAAGFLDARLDALHDPEALPDMPVAIRRIREAVAKKQRIVLFGDYDVDGVSATALLAGFFRTLKYPVQALVPERSKGGYGLSAEALERIRAHQPDLVITLDNGITAHGPLDALQQAGVDCIVVDHHSLTHDGIPKCVAVINPKRTGHDYPFRELCGAGLSFKLAWGLAQAFSQAKRVTTEFREFLLEALGLAAFGTLADMVPLIGENRILAQRGLQALSRTTAPGVAALRAIAQLPPVLTTRDVTFGMAPRLNAAGRCGLAADALDLLCSTEPRQAAELAAKLDGLNRDRQALEKEILAQARAEALKQMGATPAPKALVLYGADWHQGVIGIVASRLVEEFNRPAVMLAGTGEAGLARGSGRSIPGFDLARAFEAGGSHLVAFGGHAAAAGLTVRVDQLPTFAAKFQGLAADKLTPDLLVPSLRIEDSATLPEITASFCEELERLEPCGVANERPVFAALGVSVAGRPMPMGADEKHVAFHAKQEQAILRTVGFGMGERFNVLCELAAGSLDLAFSPKLNTFRGATSVELHLQAFRAGTLKP